MSSQLSSGIYMIVSHLEGNAPASVNLSRIALQKVQLGEEVKEWKVIKEGENRYHLSVGEYPFTGVTGDEVTAGIMPGLDMPWIVVYREFQGAYTIQPASDEAKGWTVPAEGEEDNAIKIRPLIASMSLPPRFSPAQLFRFVPADK